MSFSNAVRCEIRAAFGPKWAATGFQWGMVLVGLVLVGYVGLAVLDASATLSDVLSNIEVAK